MQIREIQATIDAWIVENGGYWDELSMLARLTEEVGELAREVNHRFGAKRKKASEEDKALADEMADVLWVLLCMANKQGIDMETAFLGVMEKVRVRDAGRYTDPPEDP